MSWEFVDSKPIYLQIIDRIQLDIARGRYHPGEKLPSVRDLAAEAAVNPNTMQKALSELEREELVFSLRTSGRYITEDESRMKEVREKLAQEQIAVLIRNLKAIGYTPEEICQAVEKAAKEME